MSPVMQVHAALKPLPPKRKENTQWPEVLSLLMD